MQITQVFFSSPVFKTASAGETAEVVFTVKKHETMTLHFRFCVSPFCILWSTVCTFLSKLFFFFNGHKWSQCYRRWKIYLFLHSWKKKTSSPQMKALALDLHAKPMINLQTIDFGFSTHDHKHLSFPLPASSFPFLIKIGHRILGD